MWADSPIVIALVILGVAALIVWVVRMPASTDKPQAGHPTGIDTATLPNPVADPLAVSTPPLAPIQQITSPIQEVSLKPPPLTGAWQPVHGWLAVFCGMLLLAPIITVVKMIAMLWSEFDLAAVREVVFWLPIGVVSCVALRALGRRDKNAVVWAKIALIWQLVFPGLVALALTSTQEFSAEAARLGGPAVYTAIWYLYLVRSERVRLTYPERAV